MKNKLISHRAFSLIELSIVILIIGILVAGVTQSSRLISQMRLSSARSLTQSSPIASIRDLALWLESTSSASFDESATDENSPIPTWYDLNPQTISKINAAQSTANKQPLYISSAINNLPAVKFDGSNDDMTLGSLSAGSNISIFYVIKPTSAHVEGLLDSAPGLPYPFRNYCESTCPSDGQFSWWNGGTAPAVNLGLAAGAPAIIYIQTVFDTSVSPAKTLRYYKNGTLISTVTDTNNVDISWTSPRLGSINATLVFYDGLIGEIIIFSRTLKAEERTSVTNYLGKKWGIAVP